MSDNDQSLYNLRYNQVTQQIEGAGGTPVWTPLTLLNPDPVAGITQLTGDVTAGPGSGSQATTLLSTTVTGKLLTGYTSGAGTVASTDTILQAIQKLNGNTALKLPLAGGTVTGQLIIQPASDSTTDFLIKTAGAVAFFTADTTNKRVSIGATSGTNDFNIIRAGGTGSTVGVGVQNLSVDGNTQVSINNSSNDTLSLFSIGASSSGALASYCIVSSASSTGLRIAQTVSANIEFAIGGLAAANDVMVLSSGGLNVGASAPVASAKLQADSTTSGFLPPRMTTTQKNGISSPAEGLVVYDTVLKKLCVYTGAGWETVTSA